MHGHHFPTRSISTANDNQRVKPKIFSGGSKKLAPPLNINKIPIHFTDSKVLATAATH